jgi:hypothetical protein
MKNLLSATVLKLVIIIVGIGLVIGVYEYFNPQNPVNKLNKTAQGFCSAQKIVSVSIDSNVVRVVSTVPGAGTSYFTADGVKIDDCRITTSDATDCMEKWAGDWKNVCEE